MRKAPRDRYRFPAGPFHDKDGPLPLKTKDLFWAIFTMVLVFGFALLSSSFIEYIVLPILRMH